jgi:hypothetical protein
MNNKKKKPAMVALFSCQRILLSQLKKKIAKLQHRAAKRQAKLEQAHAHHDHTGHDHKH